VQIRTRRIRDGPWNGCQRGLMKHHLNAFACSHTLRWIGQISLDELHLIKSREIAFLACNEAVDAPHRLSALQQRRRNRPPDETSRSCHQIFCHFFPFWN